MLDHVIIYILFFNINLLHCVDHNSALTLEIHFVYFFLSLVFLISDFRLVVLCPIAFFFFFFFKIMYFNLICSLVLFDPD